ncbi:MAG: hypothetical protein AAGF30_05055 [Pseudomonadota bacterium]
MSNNGIHAAKAEADAHRDGLAASLSALLSSRAPDRLGHDTVDQVAGIAQQVARHGLSGIKANPAGMALVGAGLAIMAMRRPDEPGPDAAAPLSAEADARIAKASERHATRARIQADRVDTRPGRARALRMKLDAGLDRLDPDARARVRAVRLKVIDAQEKIERRSAELSERAKHTQQDQPLLTTLAAAGIGALIGGLLPSTRAEQDLMGAQRDQLFREAEAVLRSEIAQLEAQGRAAVDAGMSAARDSLAGATGAESTPRRAFDA